MATTPHEAAQQEVLQQQRIKNVKSRFETSDLQVDPVKIQEWSQLVIAEQLIQIKYELQHLRGAIDTAVRKLK